MEFSEDELGCISFFPDRKEHMNLKLSEYFKVRIQYTGEDVWKRIQPIDASSIENYKSLGKDYLVEETDVFVRFSMSFPGNFGYEIIVIKKKSVNCYLKFSNDPFNKRISLSDEQTKKCLDYEKIKNVMVTYMTVYQRFEMFWNVVNCYLKKPMKQNDYLGYFLHECGSDYYNAKNNNGLIYVYGKIDSNMPRKASFIYDRKSVLIPFENFVPVLNRIIEDMKASRQHEKEEYSKL